VKPKVVREVEVGGAREGVDRSVLPPILDKEGKLEKLERQGPTPENAEAGENDCSCSLLRVMGECMLVDIVMGEWRELLTDMGAMGVGYMQVKTNCGYHWFSGRLRSLGPSMLGISRYRLSLPRNQIKIAG